MAEIDFRIPLQTRPVQTRSIAPTLLALGQLQQGQQQGRVNELLLAKGEAETQRQQELAEIFARLGGQPGQQPGGPQPGVSEAIDVPFQDISLPQGPGTLDFPGGAPRQEAGAAGQPQTPPQRQTPGQQLFDPRLPRELIRRGFFDTADTLLTMQSRQMANKKEARASQETKLMAAMNLLSVPTDEATYQAIVPRLKSLFQELGVPVSLVPGHFDKGKIDSLLNLGRTEAQRFDREKQDDAVRLKEIDQGIAEGKEARLAREGAGIGGTQAKARFDRANVLRDDFTRQSGNFRALQQGISLMRAAAANPSPAGDIALIFGFMKLVDPVSTVREGEFATVQNAGGIDERTRNLYNQLLSGTRLGAEGSRIRADFLNRGERIFAPRLEQNQRLEQVFTGMAKRAGVDPQDVLTSVPLIGEKLQADRKKALSSAVDSVRNP